MTTSGQNPRATGARAVAATSELAETEPCAREAAREVRRGLGSAKNAVLIVVASGKHGRDVLSVAKVIRSVDPKSPMLVLGTPRGFSSEGTPRASGICVLGLAASSKLSFFDQQSIEKSGSSAANAAIDMMGAELESKERGALLVFAESRFFREAGAHQRLAQNLARGCLGGSVDAPFGIAIAEEASEPKLVAAAFLRLKSWVVALAPTGATSPLTEPRRIEAIEGRFITRLSGRGGEKPLSVMEEAAKSAGFAIPVVVTIEPSHSPAGSSPRSSERGVTRAILGVDPLRHAIHVGDQIRVGDMLTFCTLRAKEGRVDFETMMREVSKDLRGNAPLAGVFISCPSRSKHVRASSSDARAIQGRFAGTPFIGVSCATQMFVSSAGELRFSNATGILALFGLAS